MKKRVHHRKHMTVSRAAHHEPQYLVVVRGWMFLVAFALMLGLGAVVGNFVNQELNISTPQVAGVTVER